MVFLLYYIEYKVFFGVSYNKCLSGVEYGEYYGVGLGTFF